jgi:hypothetical protein
MKTSIRHFLMLLAGAACPLHAIEPPVEAQPIPPRKAPAEKVAIPPRAVPVVPEFGAVEAAPQVDAERPYIGVILDPVPEILSSHLKLAVGEGLVISEVVAGGPAEKAGLTTNDIITRVNGESVGSSEEVRREVEKHGVGDQVKLEIVHGGEESEVTIVLGAAPEMMGAIPPAGMALGGANDLEGFLGNLPEKHAEWMRQAMEQQLQGLGQPGNGVGELDNWQRKLLERVERSMKAGGEGLDLGDFQAESSIRLRDDEGSIEVKGRDGSKEVRVYDQAGGLVWEGPYDTEQDKAAVPDDIRARIDQVNLDMDFGGGGLRLQMGPQRFRPLNDMAPKAREGIHDE